MTLEIGDRVTSTDVPANCNGNIFQDKQLEIVEFLANGKVKCKYFLEREVHPSIEEYIVTKESLTFINNTPLKYKGLEKDPFFDRHFKK